MNDQANAFVQEQIKLAHAQMYQEIERQVALRVPADMSQRISEDNPPLSQNRNPDHNASELMMEISQWEASQETSKQRIMNDIMKLKDKVMSNGDMLANLIGNASDME